MASILKTGSLTNLARVKSLLGIDEAKVLHDAMLEQMINGISSFIENICSRTFKSTEYTEKISNEIRGAELIFLKHAPVTTLTHLKYRTGQPNDPQYTAYLGSEFELEGDGAQGIVRLYSGQPCGSNVIECKYTAGWKIDWTNQNDPTKHTLPDDITRLAENLVVKAYKRREAKGKSSETGGSGDQVQWQKDLDVEDEMTLNQYKRARFY